MKIVQSIKISLLFLVIIWISFFANFFTPVNLNNYGLLPRSFHGLWGIVTMPFLHANLAHITSNSVALFVLMTISLMFSKKLTYLVVPFIIMFCGVMVWLFGSKSYHIGASGLVFGLFGYLLFMGILRREWLALFVSIVVFLLYGGVLFSLLVVEKNISWAAHANGLLGGIVAAFATKNHTKEE